MKIKDGLERRAFDAIAAAVEDVNDFPYEMSLDKAFAVYDYFNKFLWMDRLIEKVEQGEEHPRKLSGISISDIKPF